MKHDDTYIADYGRKLVALGQALQDSSSTIADIAQLAHECNLTFEYRVISRQEADDVEDHEDTLP